MIQQGETKQINFGGIVRNSSGSTSPDGEFEELVNLRYKDGHFIPMNANIPVEGIDNVNIEYVDIFVHSNKYQHFIGRKDGSLWYFADMDDNGVVTMLATPVKLCDVDVSGEVNKIQYTQTGNLMTIIDSGILRYLYWRKDKYVDIKTDYNGAETDELIMPEGRIDFRIAQKTYKDTEEPVVRNILGIDEWINYFSTSNVDVIKEKALALMTQSRYVSRFKGEPTGIFMVCTALKLYDGNYILQSRPVLINAPTATEDFSILKTQRRFFTTGGLNWDLSGYWYDSFGEDSNNPDLKIFETEATKCAIIEKPLKQTIPLSKYRKGSEWRYDYYCHDGTDGTTKDYSTFFKLEKINSEPDYTSCRLARDLLCMQSRGMINADDYSIPTKMMNIGVGGNNTRGRNDSWMVCMNVPHKLQYRITHTIDQSYRDLVQSICVFITEQIEPTNINDANARDVVNRTAVFNSSWEFGNTANPKLKDSKDIIEELSKLNNFYKVAEIGFNKIEKGGWIDIDMEKDGVLINLVNQETLNLDASDRNAYYPQVSLMFNGRLHLANYSKVMFRGFPLNYFYYQNGDVYGQYENKRIDVSTVYNDNRPYTHSYDYPSAITKWNGSPRIYMETTIDTDSGTRNVRRFTNALTNTNVSLLNPMISYPDARATKIKIIIQGVVNDSDNQRLLFKRWEAEFNLTKHETFDFSYYIDPDLKPIDICSDKYEKTDYRTIVTPSDINHITYIDKLFALPDMSNEYEFMPNGVRVSEVNNPMYFPAKNTYRIGNMAIIALAVNSVRMASGQLGDCMLYVFANDGVYGLFVDSSGQITYTNSAPISRDVCNNRYSVTPTDMGIVFSTFRGLYLISEKTSECISELAQGDPLEFTETTDESYMEVAVNSMKHNQLTTLELGARKTVSHAYSDFLQYIEGCVIGYNAHDKEIWVTNPNFQYSYVLSNSIWIKRTLTCSEYVSNYPETYMLDSGHLTILGKEFDNKRDADSHTWSDRKGEEVYFLSKPIKLLTQEFKQIYRIILRGMISLVDAISVMFEQITVSVEALKPLYRDILITEKRRQTIVTESNTEKVRQITLNNPMPENKYISTDTPKDVVYKETEDFRFANSFKHRYILGGESPLTTHYHDFFDILNIVVSNETKTDNPDSQTGKVSFTMSHQVVTNDYEIYWSGGYKARIGVMGINGNIETYDSNFRFNTDSPNIELESSDFYGKQLHSIIIKGQNNVNHGIVKVRQKRNTAVQYNFHSPVDDIIITPDENSLSSDMEEVIFYTGTKAIYNFLDTLIYTLYQSSDWHHVHCSSMRINWEYYGQTHIEDNDAVELHILDTLYHTSNVSYKVFGEDSDNATGASVFANYTNYNDIYPVNQPAPLIEGQAYKLFLNGLYVDKFICTQTGGYTYQQIFDNIPDVFPNDFLTTEDLARLIQFHAYRVILTDGTIHSIIWLGFTTSVSYSTLVSAITTQSIAIPFSGMGDSILFEHEHYYKIITFEEGERTEYTSFVSVTPDALSRTYTVERILEDMATMQGRYPDGTDKDEEEGTEASVYYNIKGMYEYSPLRFTDMQDGEVIKVTNNVDLTNTDDFIYRGGQSITAQDLLRSYNTGQYVLKPLTTFDRDLVVLNADSNINLTLLDGTIIAFYNEFYREVDYRQLVSEYEGGLLSPEKLIADNVIQNLESPSYLNVLHTDENGEIENIQFTYIGADTISEQELLDNYERGDYDHIPEYDEYKTIMIPVGKKIQLTDEITGKVYYFEIPLTEEQKGYAFVRYNSLIAELDRVLDEGYLTDKDGREWSYIKVAGTATGDKYAGLYVFGSYDARRWVLLGANERNGKFRDLGVLTERIDCKYFRIAFSAYLTADSYLDYIEATSDGRLLSGKIR